jgi:hypothetical protein
VLPAKPCYSFLLALFSENVFPGFKGSALFFGNLSTDQIVFPAMP